MNFNREPGRQLIPSSIPMPYPEMNPMSIMQSSDSSYNSKFPSYPHHRPIRLPDRCRSRPVIHIIESDSCSSISTCSEINSYRHRSYSYPRQRRIIQQQQPIILLPIKCQPSQQNILPTIQVQQQQQQGHVLPSISTSFEKLQQTQTRPIQYVQEAPQLQFISVEPHSTTIPQHVLVNSTNKKQLNVIKSIQRSMTTNNLPQNDLKFEYCLFD
ncbi:unnamed protein product [Rotaria sordida]|uniref:Uncharacterized protein n=1 Tax=Rotaria sordida TaxID=392033 RepID=A0A814I274_9BILA|nr:unnamed protein product [Rotaria sordida]CAF1113814.1 unnamed protein product [Rotaria sordida]CAF1217831.1 unnamed protein product [Rotaria sordida]CAF1367225.1 unnamed protein product [Rotaria sordida]CAF1368396.1 unnamed protein product [Rotaria sordida]